MILLILTLVLFQLWKKLIKAVEKKKMQKDIQLNNKAIKLENVSY